MRRAAAAFALALALAVPAGPRAESRVVVLRAGDGLPLAAAVYEPVQRPAPAILLLHMLRRSRRDWDAAAGRLRDAGFLVLALDLRGHGDSAGASGSGDLGALVRDAEGALAYLKSRPGVRADRIGIAGASLGASLAAMAGGADPAVGSLALISPSLDYRGVRCEAALRKYGNRPVLLVAAARDAYAVRSARQLATGGAGREVLITEALGHGTVLLSRSPGLVDRLVDWFRRTLL